jgi:hypothetical protein
MDVTSHIVLFQARLLDKQLTCMPRELTATELKLTWWLTEGHANMHTLHQKATMIVSDSLRQS